MIGALKTKGFSLASCGRGRQGLEVWGRFPWGILLLVVRVTSAWKNSHLRALGAPSRTGELLNRREVLIPTTIRNWILATCKCWEANFSSKSQMWTLSADSLSGRVWAERSWAEFSRPGHLASGKKVGRGVGGWAINECCLKPLTLSAFVLQGKTNAVTMKGYLEVERIWEKSHFSYNKS